MGHFWSSQVTNFLKQLFLIWKLILWHFAHCLHELVAQETREAICGIFMLIGTPLNKSLIIWVETMCHYDVKWNSQSHHQRQENVTHKRKGTVEATILLTVNRGQILGHEGKIIEVYNNCSYNGKSFNWFFFSFYICMSPVKALSCSWYISGLLCDFQYGEFKDFEVEFGDSYIS